MYTTPTEGEGESWEGRMKTLNSIVESMDHCIRLRQHPNRGQRPQISILNVNWDESSINLWEVNIYCYLLNRCWDNELVNNYNHVRNDINNKKI